MYRTIRDQNRVVHVVLMCIRECCQLHIYFGNNAVRNLKLVAKHDPIAAVLNLMPRVCPSARSSSTNMHGVSDKQAFPFTLRLQLRGGTEKLV